jgi:hypothetical protein
LPPGVKLGKDSDPGETLSTSRWPADDDGDERDEGEEIQPGDTVIELRDGVPVIYTQPGAGPEFIANIPNDNPETWDRLLGGTTN